MKMREKMYEQNDPEWNVIQIEIYHISIAHIYTALDKQTLISLFNKQQQNKITILTQNNNNNQF